MLLGCDGDAEVPWREIDQYKFRRCPTFHVQRDDVQGFLFAFEIYLDGHLPEAGGTNDQPSTFFEAVRVFRSELARWVPEKS